MQLKKSKFNLSFGLSGMVIFFLIGICNTSAQEPNLHGTPQTKQEENFYYIGNENVKLGVDLNGGGSVFDFAETKSNRNLLNHYDKGRFIQQSYYGIKDGSSWAGKPWRWNPVQGGGYKGEPAKLLERKLNNDHLWIRSRPKHWATGQDIQDCIMEEDISLEGNVAHIRYRFIYSGTIDHPESHQELPAVFVDYALPNLVFYSGLKPWTGDTLTTLIPGWPNKAEKSTENWAAYVDDHNWGIGVYTPGTGDMTTYRYKGDGKTGPKGSACSYFAPIRSFPITKGKVYEYDVYLMIGTTEKIRSAFAKIHIVSD